jgi:plastocyanin
VRTMVRGGAVALMTVGVALAVVPLVPAAGAAAKTSPVSMKDFTFIPATVTIQAGDTVRWTYDESATDPMPNCETLLLQPPSPVTCPGHSTTAAKIVNGKPLWDSGVHRADGFPYSVRFDTAGTFHYICTVHGGAGANNPVTHMEGDVVVKASATPAGSGASPAGATPHVAASRGARLPETGTHPLPLTMAGVTLVAVGAALRRAAA